LAPALAGRADMTLGLLAGYGLSAVSVLLLIASMLSGARWAVRLSAVIVSAYAVTHVAKLSLPLNSELFPLFFGAIWVSASSLMWLKPSDLPSDMKIRAHLSKSLIALNGLCYFWADAVNAPREFGSPPYVTSDVLAFVAMALIGWSLRHDVIDRISTSINRAIGLAWRSAVRSVGSVVVEKGCGECVEICEKSEALHAPKVRAHG